MYAGDSRKGEVTAGRGVICKGARRKGTARSGTERGEWAWRVRLLRLAPLTSGPLWPPPSLDQDEYSDRVSLQHIWIPLQIQFKAKLDYSSITYCDIYLFIYLFVCFLNKWETEVANEMIPNENTENKQEVKLALAATAQSLN